MREGRREVEEGKREVKKGRKKRIKEEEVGNERKRDAKKRKVYAK